MNNRAPEYLREKFKSNRELGLRRTWGYDKLHLKSVKTEWGRSSFGFQAEWDWNNLPEDIREIKSILLEQLLLFICFTSLYIVFHCFYVDVLVHVHVCISVYVGLPGRPVIYD